MTKETKLYINIYRTIDGRFLTKEHYLDRENSFSDIDFGYDEENDNWLDPLEEDLEYLHTMVVTSTDEHHQMVTAIHFLDMVQEVKLERQKTREMIRKEDES